MGQRRRRSGRLVAWLADGPSRSWRKIQRYLPQTWSVESKGIDFRREDDCNKKAVRCCWGAATTYSLLMGRQQIIGCVAWECTGLPRAVCHANQSARIATRVAMMPKDTCRIMSSCMMYVCLRQSSSVLDAGERMGYLVTPTRTGSMGIVALQPCSGALLARPVVCRPQSLESHSAMNQDR
jgi:hypothetical protein